MENKAGIHVICKLSSVFTALLVWCFCLLSAGSCQALTPLRIGAYNVHKGIGRDGNTDLARIARVIKSASLDIVGLNEINRFRFGAKQDEEYADELGPEWTSIFGKCFTPDITRDYGNAILTRLEIVSSQTYLYTKTDLEQRGFMRVTVRKDGELIHLFCTHWALDAAERLQHSSELLAVMATFTDGYRILVGDMNELPTSPAVNNLRTQYDDVFQRYGLGEGATGGSGPPYKRIDFLFLDKRLAASNCYVPTTSMAAVASDHWPVFATIVKPGEPALVRNQLTVSFNNNPQLAAADTVPDNPNAYRQGSVVVSTSGNTGPTHAQFDDLRVERMADLYREQFTTTALGAMPPDWKQLYVTPGGTFTGQTILAGAERVWRQKSSAYAKYHYAPTVYPAWKNYQFSARVKTLAFGGGVWRMNILNYPQTNTAYDTYKIEVRDNPNQLPSLRLMKGGVQLATVVMAEVGLDPFDWNVYSLQVNSLPVPGGIVRNRLTVLVNGEQRLTASDDAPDVPGAFTQGSVVLATNGASQGSCEIYADDLNVRGWQPQWNENFDSTAIGSAPPDWSTLYFTPGTSYTASVAESGGNRFWDHRSDAFLKTHYAPSPYPNWTDYRFSARAKTIAFGQGKWRMKVYNYPSTNLAYDTYKLELTGSGATPQLRLLKGAAVLDSINFSALGADPLQWQNYQIGIQSFVVEHRNLNQPAAAGVDGWDGY